MKFLRLMRKEDIHDNTGIGCVLTGAIFRGGQCAYMWKSEVGVMHWATSIDQLKNLHEHEGKGEVDVFDPEKYMSLRDFEKFMNGEPMENLKLKPKYRPKEEKKEEETDDV